MTIKHIDQTTLKSLLDYDEFTGLFTWKIKTKNGFPPGSIAGGISNYGYRVICIDYIVYSAHRLAFIWMIGEAPLVVDHKNGDKSDNRWVNLRAATNTSNRLNTKARSSNRLGIKGVSLLPSGKYSARVTPITGPLISRNFETVEEAIEFVEKHRRIEHGDFACD